jgi:hypothetical protein
MCIVWRYQTRIGCSIDVGISIHFMTSKRTIHRLYTISTTTLDHAHDENAPLPALARFAAGYPCAFLLYSHSHCTYPISIKEFLLIAYSSLSSSTSLDHSGAILVSLEHRSTSSSHTR